MKQQIVNRRRAKGVRTRLCVNTCVCAVVLVTLTLAIAASALPVADPFASQMISYTPGPDWSGTDYSNPSLALGAPVGKYVYEPDNSSLVTLGDGGKLVLKFSAPVENDPRNPYGLDFIVFGNPQVNEVLNWETWQTEYLRWQELAFVEISQDGSYWYLIKPSILPANLRVCNGTPANPDAHNYDAGKSYTAVSGYAEYTPTVGLPQDLAFPPFSGVTRTPEEMYTVPDRPSPIRDTGYTNPVRFDFVSGGGDAFDIADAVLEVQNTPGVPVMVNGQTVPADISWFSYVRITDARVGDYWPQLMEVAADIDAVSRTRPALSIGEAAAMPVGDYALVTEAIVTAVFSTEFFIGSPDRSSAMRVIWDSSTLVDERAVTVGDKITITGHVSKTDGRFSFGDPMFSFSAIDCTLPAALAVPTKSLESVLLYGMKVRTWGTVTDPGDGMQFKISYGGKAVKITGDTYLGEIADGAYVVVTGICDREEGTGSTIIRVVDPSSDIRSLP